MHEQLYRINNDHIQYCVIINVRQSTEYSVVFNLTETVTANIGLTVVMLGTIFYLSIICHLVTAQLNKIRDIIEKLLLFHPIKRIYCRSYSSPRMKLLTTGFSSERFDFLLLT
jgi:hypothetical protein